MSESDTHEIVYEWCKGCGICAFACPKKVLGVNKSGKIQVLHPEDCIKCKICENICPDFAIKVKDGRKDG